MEEHKAKLLRAKTIVSSIKEKQIKEVENLRKCHGITPKLAIVKTKNDSHKKQ